MRPEELKFRLFLMAVAITAIVLAIVSYPAYAAQDSEDCLECGIRRPGDRPRDLAMLAIPLKEAAARIPASAPVIDPTAIAKLPVQSRPSPDISESHPILRAMNTDRTTFFRLRHILPEKFRIASGAQLQTVIDESVLKMASTEAGKQAVCAFAADGIREVQMYLAVSEAAAAKVREGCKGRKYPPAIVNRLRVMSKAAPPFQPEPLIPAKKFVVVFSETGRPQIEGYSTKNNTTFLILSKDTLDSDSITRMISHEIAISYDQLSRLGYLTNPTTIEDTGVNFAFGLNIGEEVFAHPKKEELKKMQCGFRDPAIRYAAAAQRAFLFEDSVSDELRNSPSVATKGTCGEILAKNSVLLQQMSRVVSWDTGWYQAACGMAKNPADRLKQILSRIKDVENSTLKCNRTEACGGKSEMKLCDLLLNPRIGPYAQDLDGGGPRPSMGGGWGEMINSDQNLIQRASNGESLTPSELERLGERLMFPNIDDLDRESRSNRDGREI